MIAKLKGTIDEINVDHMVVDVNGVGYLVYCTFRTLSAYESESVITLQIETIIREDAFLLYGFEHKIERDWFRLLLAKVQGVGAKSAIALLSTLTISELAQAIENEDIKSITKTPGIGPKVGQRVISELKGKFVEGSFGFSATGHTHLTQIAEEAVSGLTSLGYSKDAAFNAIKMAIDALGKDTDLASLIRAGIKLSAINDWKK